MTQPIKQSREEALAENGMRLARVFREGISDIERGVPEGKLAVTLDFIETLLRQRRRIKWHHGMPDD